MSTDMLYHGPIIPGNNLSEEFTCPQTPTKIMEMKENVMRPVILYFDLKTSCKSQAFIDSEQYDRT